MYNNFYGKLGVLLKDLRKNNGYTLTAASNKIGKTKGWLGDVESGRNRIYIEDLIKLCDIYNIDLNEIQTRMNEGDNNE